VHDGDLAVLVHRQEVVAAAGGLDRVGGNADIAVGAVLEADGAERPEASSRCTWLSVVRAPMAPQLIRSPMYWGEITSRNSLAAGTPGG
jgi:hypothetical protein